MYCTTYDILGLLGLSKIIKGFFISKTSKIYFLVSAVAVAVSAMNITPGNSDRNSCSRENQILKAEYLLLLDFPLKYKFKTKLFSGENFGFWCN
jgi:hypothetical protein